MNDTTWRTLAGVWMLSSIVTDMQSIAELLVEHNAGNALAIKLILLYGLWVLFQVYLVYLALVKPLYKYVNHMRDL